MATNGQWVTPPLTDPGSIQRHRYSPPETRAWLFTEHMRLGWVQLFAGVGGGVFPALLFVRSIRSTRTGLIAVLAFALLVLGGYVLSQTRFLTRIEMASDGLRLAAGGITVLGILASAVFLTTLGGCAAVSFLLLWVLILRHIARLLGEVVNFFRGIGGLVSRREE